MSDARRDAARAAARVLADLLRSVLTERSTGTIRREVAAGTVGEWGGPVPEGSFFEVTVAGTTFLVTVSPVEE